MLSKKDKASPGDVGSIPEALTKRNYTGVVVMAKKLFSRTVLVLKVLLILIGLDAFCVNYYGLRREAETRIAAQSERIATFCVEWLGYEAAIKKASPEEIRRIVNEEAIAQGLNPGLVFANMRIESGDNQFAVSNKGAIGLAQVMPANLKRCGYSVQDGFDARKNIRCGVRVLREAHESQKWNTSKAVQAYNGGDRCVGKCAESINHSRKVLAELEKHTRSKS